MIDRPDHSPRGNLPGHRSGLFVSDTESSGVVAARVDGGTAAVLIPDDQSLEAAWVPFAVADAANCHGALLTLSRLDTRAACSMA